MQIENVNTGNSCLGANSLYNIAKIGSGFDFEKPRYPYKHQYTVNTIQSMCILFSGVFFSMKRLLKFDKFVWKIKFMLYWSIKCMPPTKKLSCKKNVDTGNHLVVASSLWNIPTMLGFYLKKTYVVIYESCLICNVYWGIAFKLCTISWILLSCYI